MFFGKKKSEVAASLCFAQYLALTAMEIATGESRRATQAKFKHTRLKHYPGEEGNLVENGAAVLEVTVELETVVTGTEHARPGTITVGPFYLRAEHGKAWHVCRVTDAPLTIDGKVFTMSSDNSPWWPWISIWEKCEERPGLFRLKATGTSLAKRTVYC